MKFSSYSDVARSKLIMGLLLLAVFPVIAMGLLSLFSRTPSNLGAVNGRLSRCPVSPNCVSTQASDPVHRIEPIHFDGSANNAITRLKEIIAAMPRAKLANESEFYMHVEFTSLIFRFVDDVEFLIDPATHTIHFRSASRVGSSDLGVNRKRMEEIRRKFDAQQQK